MVVYSIRFLNRVILQSRYFMFSSPATSSPSMSVDLQI